MATNAPSGDNHRNGAVKKRSQTKNPKNKRFVKRDSESGRFMDVKADKKPFKGVRKNTPVGRIYEKKNSPGRESSRDRRGHTCCPKPLRAFFICS